MCGSKATTGTAAAAGASARTADAAARVEAAAADAARADALATAAGRFGWTRRLGSLADANTIRIRLEKFDQNEIV